MCPWSIQALVGSQLFDCLRIRTKIQPKYNEVWESKTCKSLKCVHGSTLPNRLGHIGKIQPKARANFRNLNAKWSAICVWGDRMANVFPFPLVLTRHVFVRSYVVSHSVSFTAPLYLLLFMSRTHQTVTIKTKCLKSRRKMMKIIKIWWQIALQQKKESKEERWAMTCIQQKLKCIIPHCNEETCETTIRRKCIPGQISSRGPHLAGKPPCIPKDVCTSDTTAGYIRTLSFASNPCSRIAEEVTSSTQAYFYTS